MYEGEGDSLKKKTKPFPSGPCHGSLDIAEQWSVGAGSERQMRSGGHGVGREMKTWTERERNKSDEELWAGGTRGLSCCEASGA